TAEDTAAPPAPAEDAGAPAVAPPAGDTTSASPSPTAEDTVAEAPDKGFDEFRLDGICVALSGDGRYLAGGDLGGRVSLWDTETKRLLIQDTLPEGNRVGAVAFARGTPTLVSGAFEAPDAPLRVWQVKPAGFRHTLGEERWQTRQLVLDDAGQRVLSLVDVGGEAAKLLLLGVDGGAPLLSVPHDGMGFVSLSGDGKTVAASSTDGTVQVWRGEPLAEVVTQRFEGAATRQRLVLSGDGQKLWGAADNQVFHYVLDPTPGLTKTVALASSEAVIRGLERLTDGRVVAVTRPQTGGVQLWDADDGHLLVDAQGGCRCEAYALSADGKTLACDCVPEAVIRLWHLPQAP
ncbi:MAG: hypothetical protein EP329_00805, partial [Deltaproteobacteria bacterium]